MKLRTTVLIGSILGYSLGNGLVYAGIKQQLNYTEKHYGRRAAKYVAEDKIRWYENLDHLTRFVVTFSPGVLGSVKVERDFLEEQK